MSTPAPLSGVQQRPTDFTEALQFLQGLIGAEVRVSLNLYGVFIGAGFQGELGYVQSLPPDADAIQIVLRGGHGLFLDPAEVEVALAREPGGKELLEFHSKCGVTVTVEALAERT
jgi:hypothetical protein